MDTAEEEIPQVDASAGEVAEAFTDPVARALAEREQQAVAQKVGWHAADRMIARADADARTQREVDAVGQADE